MTAHSLAVTDSVNQAVFLTSHSFLTSATTLERMSVLSDAVFMMMR